MLSDYRLRRGCGIIPSLSFRVLFSLLLGYLLFASSGQAFLFFSFSADWKEIPQEQLDMAEPVVDPDAGIEYLFIEIEVDDMNTNVTTISHYVRFKVFNQRGLDDLEDIELFAFRGAEIRRVAARVIRQDGSIEELEKGDIYERESARFGDTRIKSKAFSFPGLEVGAIVEYQYESVLDGIINSTIDGLVFDYPCQEIVLRIRPSDLIPSSMLWLNFGETAKLDEQGSGVREVRIKNLMPMPDIEFPPPVLEVMPCYMLTYMDPREVDDPKEDFWKWIARHVYDEGRSELNPNRVVKRVTEELLEGVEGDFQKLRVLYNYAQENITNLSVETSGYTPEEREALRENSKASHVLDRGYGYPKDIRMLFGAMARAAGFETQYAATEDRNLLLFNPGRLHQWALPDILVAVKTVDGWTFHNPGNRYLPFGQLHWSNCGVTALLGDRKEERFLITPGNLMGDSHVLRNANLELDSEGNLEGTLEFLVTGQMALKFRHNFEGATDQEILDKILQGPGKNLIRSVVSAPELKNLTELDKPFFVRCHVSIPEYADSTGSRLFFNPSVFNKDEETLFDEETRDYPIYFKFPLRIEDRVNISIPEGYSLERPTIPQALGDNGAFKHELRIGKLKDGRVAYRQKLEVSVVLVEQKYYEAVRSYFGALHLIDKHLLTLRKDVTAEDTVAIGKGR